LAGPCGDEGVLELAGILDGRRGPGRPRHNKYLVEAVQHVRRMRGGAQGHLMRCSDGQFYVVKFRNNPQHLRVLTNEMLATRLAERAGFAGAPDGSCRGGGMLVEHTTELSIQFGA